MEYNYKRASGNNNEARKVRFKISVQKSVGFLYTDNNWNPKFKRVLTVMCKYGVFRINKMEDA